MNFYFKIINKFINMKILLFIVFLFNYIISQKFNINLNETKFEENKNVIDLNDNNFQEFIKNNNKIILLFYSKQCLYCENILNELNKLSIYFKNNNFKYKIIKIDFEKNPIISKEYYIKTVPKLFIINNQKPKFYKFNNDFQSILNYIYLLSNDNFKIVDDIKDINTFINKNFIILLNTYNKESNEYYLFKNISKNFIDSHLFLTCNLNECYQKFKKNNIYILKLQDEKIVKFNDSILNKEKLLNFISKFSLPIGKDLNPFNIHLLFKFKIPAIFYFRDSNNLTQIHLDNIIKEIGLEFRDKFLSFTLDIKGNEFFEEAKKVFQIFSEDLPCIFIYDLSKDTNQKPKYIMSYKYKINKENIKNFIKKFLNNSLEQISKSEPIPKIQLFPFVTVVGRTYDRELYKEIKTIVFLYINMECDKCQQALNIIGELSAKYQRDLNDTSFVFKEILLGLNEIKFPKINKFPTILLFYPDNKDNPIEYKGNLYSWELEKWLAQKFKWKKIPDWDKNITKLKEEKQSNNFNLKEKNKNSHKNDDL